MDLHQDRPYADGQNEDMTEVDAKIEELEAEMTKHLKVLGIVK